MKEQILTEARKLKPVGIQIYEEFSEAAAQICKQNWEKVKELWAQNKYAVLVYNRIYSTG